ncbi:MAG: ribonuclease P protein subunit [Candidatus Altiarchaeales archaeon]|nr:ribonuclease P protein subunit [Candidatus Altiarchaeales archaeon]MBD3416343.1 ribonuclease P protein subunit [Candidatus Altiarchaeales archaeon]
MITPYNILRHELVGLEVNADISGARVSGVVDGETSKTIKVKTPRGLKTVVKDSANLEFRLPDNTVVRVEGNLLAGRPEDRIKKKHRIRF